MAQSDNFQAHRPPNYSGQGDDRLPGIIRALRRLLTQVQKDFKHATLRLTAQELAPLG